MRQLRKDHAELVDLASAALPGDPRSLDAQDRIRQAERHVTEIDDELVTLQGDLVDENEVASALTDFESLWKVLSPAEQARVVELLVERVAYNGRDGTLSVTFRATGIRTLADEFAIHTEDVA